MNSSKTQQSVGVLNSEAKKNTSRLDKFFESYKGSWTMALTGGFVVAFLGAVFAFLLGLLLKIEIGYVTIFTGIVVGVVMRRFLNKPSIIFAFVAALITLFSIFFGKFLYWNFAIPDVMRNEIAIQYEVPIEEVVAEFPDAKVLELYPFMDYMSDDLSLSGDSSSDKGEILVFISYLVGIGFAFVKVVAKEKKEAATNDPKNVFKEN